MTAITNDNYHVAMQSPCSEEPKRSYRLIEKISSIAFRILDIIASVSCYYLNPTLFCGGFLIGIICDKPMKAIHAKLIKTWQHQSWMSKIIILAGAILSLPITITVGAFLQGVHVGASIAPQEI